MNKDDVFVGLPYVFKMEYDELRQITPKFSEYYEKVRKMFESNVRDTKKLKEDLHHMNELVDKLFDDLNNSRAIRTA